MGGPFLDELDEPARAELRRIAVRRSWTAGSTLFHEGARADQVVIIESGVAKAVAASEKGVDTVLAVRGPGEILGEITAVGGGARTASVVAIEPVTALVIPADTFRAFLRDHTSVTSAVLNALSDRLRDAGRRQAEYGTLDTTARLARLLVELAEAFGEPTGECLRLSLLSQDELASYCSASREAVARALRTLRDEGLISTGRKTVTIMDAERLRTWSSAEDGLLG